MFLYVTTIDQRTEWREFFCQVEELEHALEILQSLAGHGNTLVGARLVDQNSALELPLDALDGHSFREPIQRLRTEWELILDTPARQSEPLVDELGRRLAGLWRQKEESLLMAINHMQTLLQRTAGMRHGPLKSRLVSHYQTTLASYMQSLNKHQRQRPKRLFG